MDLRLLGWDQGWVAALAAAGEDLEAGRVAASNRGACRLWTVSGERDAIATGATAVTGDWVGFELASGRIRAVLPRRTRLSRKKAGRAVEEQVLAANVDVMFVVLALDADFNLRRLERYLVVAAESGTAPVVVLNKADLCDDLMSRRHEVDRITAAPAVVMSALDAAAVSQLHRHMQPGQTAALLGSSGVGKSTIVNALLGAERQAVAAVRDHDHRGRHATTGRELFLLDAGWVLMDMPGLRELEPWSGVEAVGGAFGDIEAYAAGCRFRDCRHSGEPGCRVAHAVAEGALDAARLASYHKLLVEIGGQQRKRRDRIIHRAMRQMERLRDKW